MLKGFIMAFFKKKKEEIFHENVFGPMEYIVACLGNPGKEYEYTRHNAGFLFADIICNKYGLKCDKLKFKALCGETMISAHRCLIMKPQTYMNLSGDAISEAAFFYKIPPENVIIIYDDISLPFAKMRIRRKGSAGGHNGIKSIIYRLNSDNFPRIKIGVGDRADKNSDLKDYVLGSFSKNELDELKKLMEQNIEALELITDGKIDEAMNKYSK